jgi:TonB family protein
MSVWLELPVTSPKLACITLLLVGVSTAAQAPPDSSFPKPMYSELPTYPERARTAHVAGPVKLWFIVSESGVVTQAEIISGNPLLRDTALGVVKGWKFRSGTIQPSVRYETEFIYDLNVQSKQSQPKLTVSMTDFRRVEVASELYVAPIE